jgi:hypothetical protein
VKSIFGVLDLRKGLKTIMLMVEDNWLEGHQVIDTFVTIRERKDQKGAPIAEHLDLLDFAGWEKGGHLPHRQRKIVVKFRGQSCPDDSAPLKLLKYRIHGRKKCSPTWQKGLVAIS